MKIRTQKFLAVAALMMAAKTVWESSALRQGGIYSRPSGANDNTKLLAEH